MTGAANTLVASASVVAANIMDRVNISAPQVLGLQCVEILQSLRAGLVVEVVSHPVAKRPLKMKAACRPKCRLTWVARSIALWPTFGLIGFLGTGVSLTGHHAEFAETRHECFIGIAALFAASLSQHVPTNVTATRQAASMVRMGYASTIVSRVSVNST